MKAAHKHGKWVGICGELAADPKAVPILMGLGVDELSMSPNSIPLVKAQIRTLSYSHAQSLRNKLYYAIAPLLCASYLNKTYKIGNSNG